MWVRQHPHTAAFLFFNQIIASLMTLCKDFRGKCQIFTPHGTFPPPIQPDKNTPAYVKYAGYSAVFSERCLTAEGTSGSDPPLRWAWAPQEVREPQASQVSRVSQALQERWGRPSSERACRSRDRTSCREPAPSRSRRTRRAAAFSCRRWGRTPRWGRTQRRKQGTDGHQRQACGKQCRQ